MKRPFRRRVPGVRQHDRTDCGAACLASVAEHFGLRLPLARIRQLAATDERGTTVLGILEAARILGFTATGVRGTPESIPLIPKPAIAHVVIDEALHHFVVIYGLRRGRLVIMEPRSGRSEEITMDAFTRIWTGVLVLLAPDRTFEPGDLRGTRAARFWALLRPHRTVMAQALIGALLYTLIGLSSAVFVQKVVDHVLSGGNRNLLNLMGVVMIALLVIQIFLGAAKDMYTLRVGQRIDAALIMGYYRHLLRLPQRFFDTMRVGEIVARVGDAVKIRAFLNDVSVDLVVDLLIVLFATLLMFLYSWRLAMVMLMILPIYGIVYLTTNRANRNTQRQVMESAAALESQLVESVTAAGTIRRFGAEEHATLKTEARFVSLLRGVYRSGRTQIASSSASDLISRMLTIVVLWIGASFVIDRSLTPGQLMSFYALAGHLSGPVVRLVGMNRTLQDALIAADRLFEILDLERDEYGSERLAITRAELGDIRFEAVAFRYGSRFDVFRHLDLTLSRGAMTAIVGESGCGKSTLAALIQKVYPVNGGAIRIGGVNLRNFSQASIREIIACVPQEIHLFAGSVVENIAVGEAEPDLRRVLEVANEVGVTDFVERMPAGFQSQVGERGAALSGGERQRIAIARALYREPEILILDEATSSLDSTAESLVRSAVESFRRRGGTVILIAHRLSLVTIADRVVVLEKGEVVESGTHEQLMATGGRYHLLWMRQFGGGGWEVAHNGQGRTVAPELPTAG